MKRLTQKFKGSGMYLQLQTFPMFPWLKTSKIQHPQLCQKVFNSVQKYSAHCILKQSRESGSAWGSFGDGGAALGSAVGYAADMGIGCTCQRQDFLKWDDPIARWFTKDNPMNMDDLGYRHFSKHPNRCVIFGILTTKIKQTKKTIELCALRTREQAATG